MKKCHACGQRLPLKVGDIVETRSVIRIPFVGMVVDANTPLIGVVGFNGEKRGFVSDALTRCHGYYRITERESMQ